MKSFYCCALFCLATIPSAFASVTITSPATGSTVTSPVQYSASATAPACASGVAAVGLYVNNQLKFKANGGALSTSVVLASGSYHTVVVGWDNCGGATNASADITVPGAQPTGPPPPDGVTVQSPANGSTVSSPASFAATAYQSKCAQGIAAMGIYVSDQLKYQVNGGSLSTSLVLANGPERTVVVAWDNCGGASNTPVNINVQPPATLAVAISASPTSIQAGSTATLTVSASAATQVQISGSDGTSYTLPSNGGTQMITPAANTTYTATATGTSGKTAANTTVTVVPSSGLQAIGHVLFMLQENHSFDSYFGMLNPYRATNGWNIGADGKTYTVDGIDDKLTKISNQNDEGLTFAPFKLTSTCVDDLTSSWLESYGDVSRYDFSPTRQINMDGFVHTAEGYARSCAASNGTRCAGAFTETTGKRSMGYYDQGFLNYYYYMASQFAVSDRWFSPVSSKSVPNRIATYTGGTTQGLVFDPGGDDQLPQLKITSIFEELDGAKVPWKIYYTVTQGSCLDSDDCTGRGASALYPATDFGYLTYSFKYLYENPTGAACVPPTQASSIVGDTSNSFCVDPTHIAPLSQYYTDLTNNTLPSFGFIEAGYGQNDEHPGSGQSIITGQQQVAKVVNAFMGSPAWKNSVFFLSYDEGGGPYDHVPPVPGHSNDNTDAMLGSTPVSGIPDISSIAKSPDAYTPCLPSGGAPTLHCDLAGSQPGTTSTDAAAVQGFGAQLGFRVPNIIISPYTRKHFVSHVPMDHTAILKFVENRFIGPNAHLTARDAAQPNLLDFFDFTAAPWATPPTPPVPVSTTSLGYDPCTPTKIGN